MMEEKIIFPEDVTPKKVTISQWDNGTKLDIPITLYLGKPDESLRGLSQGILYYSEMDARNSLTTHNACKCGCAVKKPYTICDVCEAKKNQEYYAALPKKEWCEDCLVCDENGHFFSEWYEVFDFLFHDEAELKDIELFFTEEQKYEGNLDFYNLFEDILPEDFDDRDIPKPIQQAIDLFNKTIDDLNLTASYTEASPRTAVLISEEILKDFENYKKEWAK